MNLKNELEFWELDRQVKDLQEKFFATYKELQNSCSHLIQIKWEYFNGDNYDGDVEIDYYKCCLCKTAKTFYKSERQSKQFKDWFDKIIVLYELFKEDDYRDFDCSKFVQLLDNPEQDSGDYGELSDHEQYLNAQVYFGKLAKGQHIKFVDP